LRLEAIGEVQTRRLLFGDGDADIGDEIASLVFSGTA
jgi:hypothetical protein